MCNKNGKTYLLMTLATLFWGAAFIAGKIGVGEFSPVTITFFRFLFATIIVFIVVLRRGENWKIHKEDWLVMIALGVIGMVGYHIMFFNALKYTSATNASIIAATNPLITAILASIFINEKLSIKKIGIILLGLLGVVLTITNWDLKVLMAFDFNKGDIMMVIGITGWAVYTIIAKKAMNKFNPLILTLYSFFVCVLVLMPFAMRDIYLGGLSNVTSKGWLSVIYMAVFPTAIGYLVQQYAIDQIGPTKSSMFSNLVPVFSIIFAMIILKEEMSVLKLISAGIIILSVYLNSKLKVENKGEVKEELS